MKQEITQRKSLDIKRSQKSIFIGMNAINGSMTEKESLDFINIVTMAFPKIEQGQLDKAILNGVTGLYGRSYRTSKQEVLLWIRCFIENKKPRDFEYSKDEL